MPDSLNTRAPARREGRCVECGQRGVTAGEACRYRKDGHGLMDLPEGKTCGDCLHIRRCQSIFGHIPEDEVCDWFPSRYAERPTTEGQ